MIVTAFLGLLHSPKWFKFNHNNNNHNNNKNNHIIVKHKTNDSLFFPINRFDKLSIRSGIRHASTLAGPSAILPLTLSSLSSGSAISRGWLATENSEVLKEFLKEKNLNPVFIYENLGGKYTKQKVLEETRDLSGVYLILNKITLDYYVGSASTNKFYARFSNHLFNFNGSKIVKAAVRKYKISEFAFIVLELFPEVVTKENNKRLLDLEDFYLKSLLPTYNILTEAGSSFGYKHTEMTRINMKANYSMERRLQIGNLNKGKKFSEETLTRMREKALSREKPIYSKEALESMRKSSKAIIVYNLDDTVYGEFPSIVEGAKSLNCDEKTIRRALKSEKKLLKRRWIVKYLVVSQDV